MSAYCVFADVCVLYSVHQGRDFARVGFPQNGMPAMRLRVVFLFGCFLLTLMMVEPMQDMKRMSALALRQGGRLAPTPG